MPKQVIFLNTQPAANDPDNWNQMVLLTKYGIPYIPALISPCFDNDCGWF